MPPRTRKTDDAVVEADEQQPVEQPTPQAEPPVHVALSRVMRDVGAVGKDSTNSQQGFRFRGVDAVVNAVHPALVRHGVVVVPSCESIDYATAPTRNGGTTNLVRVRVAYRFIGPAGDEITSRVAAESFDSGDKATAKAMSVAFRTALLQTLTLPTDEPDDPDHVTYERGDAPARQPQAAPPPAAQPPAEKPQDVMPAATAIAYRAQIIEAVDTTDPGPGRDGRLRPLHKEITNLGGLRVTVPLPSGWGEAEVTLDQLVRGARGERRPSGEGDNVDPWATPADDR